MIPPIRWRPRAALARSPRAIFANIFRLHRDERGAMSILTVATIIGLIMLMSMVINLGRHIDDKVKLQNAADAAAYSGGVVLARGMNAIAFSNHLLADVFALTAYMREARDRNAEAVTTDVLDAWARVGAIFSQAEFPKFSRLGSAISAKVPMEQNAVRTFSEMSAAISDLVLPVLEYVLVERLIPEYQRAVVQSMPAVSQYAADEISRRHGLSAPERSQTAVLWRTNVQAVSYPDEYEPLLRTLPAIDPTPGASAGLEDPTPDPSPDPLEGYDYGAVSEGPLYLNEAIRQRRQLATEYLNAWNQDRLRFFANRGPWALNEAKMSQFFALWESYTCGQLTKLLTIEFPNSNVPHMLRLSEQGLTAQLLLLNNDQQAINTYLDRQFMFLGVAYARKFTETARALFRNPLDNDPMAFAQIHLFIPRARLWLARGTAGSGGAGAGGGGGGGGGGISPREMAGAAPADASGAMANDVAHAETSIGHELSPFLDLGGGLGIDVSGPEPGASGGVPGPMGATRDRWFKDWPEHWDLFNQNWTVQLVPSTSEALAGVLQAQPPAEIMARPWGMRVLRLRGMTSQELRDINTH